MSKSLEFCRQAVSDPKSKYFDRNWDEVIELDPSGLFNQYLSEPWNWCLTKYGDTALNFSLEINPDADFQYFVDSSCIHEFDSSFVKACGDSCVYKVISGQAYEERLDQLKDRGSVHYIVGNLVVLSEHDTDGVKFSPKDEKWMNERTTTLLPIKMWVEREGNKCYSEEDALMTTK